MNTKTMLPLFAAIALGGVAAKVAHDVAVKNRTAAAAVAKAVKVVVAKGMVTPGSELTSDDLTLAPIVGEVPPPKTFSDISDLVGRVATVPLLEGQAVLQDFLAPKGSLAGLSSLIPKGMRAITLDVNDQNSISGLLVPGSRVDVVATITGGSPDKTVTRTVVENLLVSAVGQRLSPFKPEGDKDKDNQPYHTVTLVASPHDAQLVELAMSSSKMRLVLRARGDDAPAETPDVTLVDLRGRPQAQPEHEAPLPVALERPATRPSAPRTATRTTKVIRAGAEINIEFPVIAPASESITKTDQEPAAPQD